jgi:hypothetical protein
MKAKSKFQILGLFQGVGLPFRFESAPSPTRVMEGLGRVAGGSYGALTHYLYQELMYFVAGMVAEVKIAGYPAAYAEVDTTGRPRIEWDAIRAARLEAGLPICGHKDCEIPVDTSPVDAGSVDAGSSSVGRITEEDVAAIIKRAEDEVFALLKANWRTVLRVVNALCKRGDKITSIEFDALMAGPKRRAGKQSSPAEEEPPPAW